jgi:hypothetical protein
MDQSWHDTNLLLTSIHQEYLAICRELQIATDIEYAIRLRALAAACVADYLKVLRQYHAAKQSLH